MSVSIMEALQCAEINFGNVARMNPGDPMLFMAKEQLHNAITLLEKGYDLSEEVEPLLEAAGGKVEDVPDHEDV
jgi:hypothetical protein